MRCITFGGWLGWLVFIIIVSILVDFGLGFLPGGIGRPISWAFQIGVSIVTTVLFFDMLATVLGLSDDRCDSRGYYSFLPRPRPYMKDRATGATWPA